MPAKVISIEEDNGPYKPILRRVMRMVPEKDQNDKNLKRLIAFRVMTDGEAATTEYLLYKIREIIKCGYRGSLYDYLKDDLQSRTCGSDDEEPLPPSVA